MAKLTGKSIIDKYSPGIKVNSFYEEQKEEENIDLESGIHKQVYYVDNDYKTLRVKNTLLLN